MNNYFTRNYKNKTPPAVRRRIVQVQYIQLILITLLFVYLPVCVSRVSIPFVSSPVVAVFGLETNRKPPLLRLFCTGYMRADPCLGQ